jgi:hypothetical protein
MILLASTSDLVRVITSAAVNTDVHASLADLNGTTVTPGRTNTPITTATTTTVVGSPGASTYRTVKTLTVRNRHASTAQTVTIVHTDGTNAMEIYKATLAAGESLHYDEHRGWRVMDYLGRVKMAQYENAGSPAVNTLQTVVLGSDVINNNATLNTIADITGLSFAVTAGEMYWFKFNIFYTSAATTTGSRFSVSGPSSPTKLVYMTEYSLAATTTTRNANNLSYDLVAASNATSSSTGHNQAIIEGWIQPSANGTLVARFASEVANSAITAKAGSLLQYMRTI